MTFSSRQQRFNPCDVQGTALLEILERNQNEKNSVRTAHEMKFWPQPLRELALHACVQCSSCPLGKPGGLSCYLQQLVGTSCPHSRTIPTPLQFPLLISSCFCPWPWCWCSSWVFLLSVLKVLGLDSLLPPTHTHTHTHSFLEICAFIFLPHGNALALTLCLGAQNWGQEREP